MQQNDDLIKRLMDAGATDDEIVGILKEKKMQTAGASAPVASVVPPKKEQNLQEAATGALEGISGLFRGAKEGIVKGSEEVLNTIAKNNPMLPMAGALGVKPKRVELFKDTKKREGLTPAENVGEFVGRMIPGMVVSTAVAGAVNPVLGPLGQRVLGPAAVKLASKIPAKLSSKAMQEAVEVGITTIPQEIFSGSIAEAFINPESFQDWKSTARVAALSSIGSIFNMGGAYMGAIKNAKGVKELEVIQQQIKELNDDLADVGRFTPNAPKPQAGPILEGEGRQLLTANQVATSRYFDKELPDPNLLPTQSEAAINRVNSWNKVSVELQAQIDKRVAELQNIIPKRQFDPIEIAAGKQEQDPIIRAAQKATDDRLWEWIQTSGGGGKGVLTDTRVPLEGVTQPSFLTIDELNDHLRVLNMASISAEPKFKKGQRFIVPRTSLPSADEAANMATSRVGLTPFKDKRRGFSGTEGPIKAIDKTVQASFKDIQARLDDASARGIGTLDPEETQQIVGEMLSMSRRLSRGFEIPYKPKTVPIGPQQALKEGTERYIEGFDLPTSAKLSDPDFASNQLDPSGKRWVTGSDDPPQQAAFNYQDRRAGSNIPEQTIDINQFPPTPTPPNPPAIEPKIEYADAVRNANIDYTKQSRGIGSEVLNKLKNFRQEFMERTWGVEKYDKESGELLSLLSGVPAHADDFVKREMRVAVRDVDGVFRGNSRVVDGAPLARLVDGLKADEVVEGNAYLKVLTLRDSKLKDPKFVSDLDDATINAILDNAPQKIKDFATGFKVISDALVEDGLATGAVSADRADILQKYFYASLGRSFNNPRQVNYLAKRTGSKRTSLPPIDLMQDVIFRTLERNRKNAGFARLVDAAEANPEAFKDIVQPVDLSSALENVPGYKQNVDDLVKEGYTYNEATQMAALDIPLFDQSNGTLRVFRDGKMSLHKVNESVAKAYQALSPVEFNILGAITSAMSAPFRTTTSLALDYSLIGPLSDTILTSAKNPWFIPFVHSMEGVWHNIMKTESYFERRAAGAGYGGRFESDQMVVYKNGTATKIGEAGKALNAPLKIMQALINPLSDAARMGDYAVRRRHGQSVLEAALASKRTLGDFNQVGASMRGWSLVTAFGNVGIQTADAAAATGREIFREGKKRNFVPLAKAATTFAATITLPTYYFWAKAQGDDELNAYRKSDTGYRFWWDRLPVDVPGIGEAGDIIKVPKLGWWAGQAFGSTLEAYLDGLGPEEKKRVVDGMVSQVGINPIPLSAQQAFGFMTNTRNPLSTGDKIPITPPSQENLLPEMQGNERTSPLARTLADKAGINPFKTDFIIESAGGSFFGNIVRQIGPNNVKLEKTDIPIIGRFAVKKGAPTEGSSQFYRDIEEARKFDESLTRAMESGDVDKARKIEEEGSLLITIRPIMEKHVKKIGEINKWIYTITMDPSLSPEGKREFIDNLRKDQNEMFRMYAEDRKSWIELKNQ